MGFFTDHAHTAVTDLIDNVIESDNLTMEVELANILQAIRRGDSQENQTEAARAIRKKLKYGDAQQKSRALDLLNLFVSQLIDLPDFYQDFKLNTVLSDMARGSNRYSSRITKKAIAYEMAWYQYLQMHQDMEGFEQLFLTCEAAVANRNKIIKKANKNHKKQKRPVPRFMKDTADRGYVTPDEIYGIPQINLEKETPKIKMLISDSLATAISLQNTLIALPKGTYSTDDEECTAKFIQARAMRRKVLRYLQLITGGEFLGSLIHANEELVEALTKFDEAAGEVSLSSSDEEDEDGAENPEEYSAEEGAAPYSYGDDSSTQLDNPFGDQFKIKN